VEVRRSVVVEEHPDGDPVEHADGRHLRDLIPQSTSESTRRGRPRRVFVEYPARQGEASQLLPQ
jgi:hypothetical protein